MENQLWFREMMRIYDLNPQFAENACSCDGTILGASDNLSCERLQVARGVADRAGSFADGRRASSAARRHHFFA
jgi:hypothetical protein